MPRESPRAARPTWRGRKGWSCPLRSHSRCARPPITSRYFPSNCPSQSAWLALSVIRECRVCVGPWTFLYVRTGRRRSVECTYSMRPHDFGSNRGNAAAGTDRSRTSKP